MKIQLNIKFLTLEKKQPKKILSEKKLPILSKDLKKKYSGKTYEIMKKWLKKILTVFGIFSEKKNLFTSNVFKRTLRGLQKKKKYCRDFPFFEKGNITLYRKISSLEK